MRLLIREELGPQDAAGEGGAAQFTAVVVDCEGAFPDVVDDFRTSLRDSSRVPRAGRRVGTDYSRVDAALEKANLALVPAASKHRVYVKATAADLKKRDAEKVGRLNNRVDAKTAASVQRGASSRRRRRSRRTSVAA